MSDDRTLLERAARARSEAMRSALSRPAFMADMLRRALATRAAAAMAGEE